MRSTMDSNRLYMDENGRATCELIGLFSMNPKGSIFAYEMAISIRLAIQHLNEGNGILVSAIEGLNETCPITFTSSVTDTAFNPTHAFAEVDKLTETSNGYASINEWRPCAFVGATGSSISKTTAMINGLRGIPQVSPASTNEDLDSKKDYKTFARTIPDDGFMAKAYVKFFYDTLNVRHLFVIVESESFPRSVLKSIRKAVHDLGLSPGLSGTSITEEGARRNPNTNYLYIEERIIENPKDDPDETSIYEAIEALKDSDFRFILVLGDRDSTSQVMEKSLEMGVAGYGTHQFWFYEGMNLKSGPSEAELNLAKAYNGTAYIYQTSEREGNRYRQFVKESIEIKQELYRKYGDKNDTVPYLGLFNPHRHGVHFYNETDWLVDNYKNEKPLYAYDATILLGLSACREVNVSSMELKGGNFFDRILRTNFTGMTGEVVLDPKTGTRDGNSVQYAIDNILAAESNNTVTFEQVQTYISRPGAEQIWETVNPHIFNGGKTLDALGPMPDLPQIKMSYNTVDLWVLIVAYGLLVIILGVTIGFTVWTFKKWDSRVIKASQPHFLLLICFGIAIMAFTIVPLTLEHVNVFQPAMPCTSIWWFAVIGFGITFSTLFAKTYRINKIVASSLKCRRVQLSMRETLYPVVGMLCFNVIMLSFMTVFQPISYSTLDTKSDKFYRTIEQYGQCNYSDSYGFLIAIICVNFCMVGLALVQAWRARYLSTEFAESKYMANALLISFLVAIFAIPVLILTQENPNVDTFVSTIIVSIIAGNTLCFMFLPKILFYRSEMQGTSKKSSTIAKAMRLTSATSAPGNSEVSYSKGLRNANATSSPQQQQDDVGERILTTKTQEQLASENTKLQLAIETIQKEKADLQKRLSDATSMMMSDKQSASEQVSGSSGDSMESLPPKDSSSPILKSKK